MKSIAIPIFRIVEQMEAAFHDVTSFEPSSLMTSASPRAALNGCDLKTCLSRSFHYLPYGSFVTIQAHGSPRSAWVQHIVECLLAAGYTRTWRLKDEIGFKRWVSGQRARTRELAFLKELGESGSPRLWPLRTRNSQPIRPRKLTQKTWELVLDAVRMARVEWDYCMLSYSRQEEFVYAPLRRAKLDVLTLVSQSGPSDLSVAVCVYVGDPIQELNPEILRSVSHDLRRAGYKLRIAEGQIWGDNPAQKNIASAARESMRIFKFLTARLNGRVTGAVGKE